MVISNDCVLYNTMNASGVASRNDAKLVCGYPIHLYVGGNGVCTLWSTKGRTELIDKIRDVRDNATLNQSETSVKKIQLHRRKVCPSCASSISRMLSIDTNG